MSWVLRIVGAAASILFWLLPSATTVTYPKVGGAESENDGRWPFGWLRSAYKDWQQRRRQKVYKEIIHFVVDHCLFIWAQTLRQGFVFLNSKCPQTVYEHVVNLINTFIIEAREEELSPSEIMEGVCGAIVHEMDEAATGKDKARLSKGRRTSREKKRVWWPQSSWIPQPGKLNEHWLSTYNKTRPVADRFVKKTASKELSRAIMWYFDAFHNGMSRVWVLLRDCHYEELVFEAIHEGVDARDFYVDAIINIEHARIRMRVVRAYEEAVVRGEQDLVELPIRKRSLTRT